MNTKRGLTEALERMHLQWFADPDIEDDGVEEAPRDEQPDRAWGALDDEIEEYDDSAPEEPVEDAGPSLEEVARKISDFEARSQGSSHNEALAGALSQLGDAIKDLKSSGASKAEQDRAAATAEKTYQELLKEAENTYYDHPVETLDKLVTAKIREMVGPGLRQVAEIAQATRRGFSEFEAKSDSTGERVLKNYRSEVDEEVNKNGGDYRAAVQTVAGRHMTDLIQMGIDEAMAAREADAAKPEPEARNRNPRAAAGRRPAVDPNKIQVPKSLAPVLRDEAERRGVDYGAYVRYLKKNQPERLKSRR